MSFRRLLVLTLWVLPAAMADRWDLVASGGAGLANNIETGSAGLRVNTGRAAAMINTGVAVASAGPGRFEVELPLMWSGSARVLLARNAVSSADSTWSIIPGVRYRLAPDRRLSPFASLGLGMARATEVAIRRFDVIDIGAGVNRLAIGYGAGLDLLLVGPLKLRAELRSHAVRNTIQTLSLWDHRPMFFVGIGFGL